jgi:hypothetical protein
MAPIPEREYYHLAAQLQYQQRRIAELEAENNELQRRLNDLRRGIGITVTVQGQTMTLTSPVITVVNQSNEPADPGITGIFPTIGKDTPLEQPLPPRSGASAAESGWEREADTAARIWRARPLAQRGAEHYSPPTSRSQQHEARDWPSLSTKPHSSGHRSRPVPSIPARGAPPSPAAPRVQEPFSTLASLTGHHPAVQQREHPRGYPSAPTDYTDSFVLG